MNNYFYGTMILEPLGVHAIVRNDASCSVAGVSIVRAGEEIPIEPEWYNIECDGRYVLVKRAFFMQYQEEKTITLMYQFDNGDRQQVEITLNSQ